MEVGWEKWDKQSVFTDTSKRKAAERLPETFRTPVAQAFDIWSLGRQQDFRHLTQLPECSYWITGDRDEKFTALANGIASGWKQRRIAGGHRLLWDAPEVLAEILRGV